MPKSGLLLAMIVAAAALGTASPQAQEGRAAAKALCAPAGCGEVGRHKVRKARNSRAARPPAAKPPQPKQEVPERTPYTDQDAAAAIVPGLPDVRFFADSIGAFAAALPRERGPWLLLSSGGSSGAFGAGVLVGLSEAGKRPDFSVVTGVSIGAVMSPYVFLGAKYNDLLRDSFLSLTSADVFEDASRADSLVDTWPLKDLLVKRVTPQLLADIAAEHGKGRRLFVITADLDSERAVVWNMGAIAERGGDAGLKLFRQVLLAASAIPGVFPPVYIDVEANGKKFQEMHADGGVFGPFFAGPPSWLIEPASDPLPVSDFYVILHTKLVPEFDVTAGEKIFILGKTISAAVKSGAQAELALLSAAAKRDGIGVNVAYVDSSFQQPAQTSFDQKQMTALFELGREQGKNGTAFRSQNPRGEAQTKQ